MNINIEKAIKFQFADKKWVNKIGPHIGIMYGMIAIWIVSYFCFIFGVFAFSANDESEAIAMILGIVILLVALLIGAFYLLYSLYLSGYLVEIVRNEMIDKTELPEIKPIGTRILTGLKICLIGMVPMVVLYVVFFGGMILAAALSSTASNSDATALIISIFMMILMLLYYVILFLYSIFIAPSMMYLFIKEGVGAALSPSKIIRVIKAGWVDLLLYFALIMAASFTLVIVMCVPFIGAFLYPAIMVMYFVAAMNLYGQTFKNIETKLKGK